MDVPECTPIPSPPSPASPNDPLLAPPTRRNTASSTGSGRPIPAGHWTLNLSGNCPRCHHHHRTVRIHVRASGASSQIGDVNCSNCNTLWLGSGARNSTRISLLSINTIPGTDLIEEIEFRSPIVQMLRSATAIAALSPALSGIPERVATNPTHIAPPRSPTHTRGPPLNEGHPGSRMNAGKHTFYRPPLRSSSDRISKSASTGSRYTQSPRIMLLHLGRRIEGTFPNFKTTRLGRFIKLETCTSPPEEEVKPSLRSSSAPFSASHVPISQSTEETIEVQGDESRIGASSTSAAEALGSPEVPDPTPSLLSTMSVEQRNAWARTQFTDFRARDTIRTPVDTSAMVDNGTQLNLGDTFPTGSKVPFPYHLDLAGIEGHVSPSNWWEVNRGSTTSLNRPSLSITESHFSQNDTVIEGASAPYLFETLHRENRRSSILRSVLLQSSGLQHTFQPGTNPRASLDSVTAASIRSIASTTRERASIRSSWQGPVRGSGLNHTEEPMVQSEWQTQVNTEAVRAENDEQSSPPPSTNREHRIST